MSWDVDFDANSTGTSLQFTLRPQGVWVTMGGCGCEVVERFLEDHEVERLWGQLDRWQKIRSTVSGNGD